MLTKISIILFIINFVLALVLHNYSAAAGWFCAALYAYMLSTKE